MKSSLKTFRFIFIFLRNERSCELSYWRLENLSDKYDWIKVNSFYSPNQIILNEEGQRAGEIFIDGRYVKGIEELIE